MSKGCLIQAGSKIIFYVNDGEYGEAEAIEDFEVSTNVITMINGLLVCTDSINPVEKLTDTEYRINCWLQDCIYINDGKAYGSAFKAD